MTALIINLICFALIFITTSFTPKWHRVLRNFKIYYLCFFLSLGVIVINIIEYNQHKKLLLFLGFAPILFLVSYKLFDTYILFKLNRHFYFGAGRNRFLRDEETKESTWIEGLFQMFLFFIPILCCIAGNYILKNDIIPNL